MLDCDFFLLAGIPDSPAAFYHFLMDAAGRVTIKKCHRTCLDETGLLASDLYERKLHNYSHDYMINRFGLTRQ